MRPVQNPLIMTTALVQHTGTSIVRHPAPHICPGFDDIVKPGFQVPLFAARLPYPHAPGPPTAFNKHSKSAIVIPPNHILLFLVFVVCLLSLHPSCYSIWRTTSLPPIPTHLSHQLPYRYADIAIIETLGGEGRLFLCHLRNY